MEKNFELNKEEAEFLLNGINKFRIFILKHQEHIKKYYKCRRIHSEILNSMGNYITSNKYDLNDELDKISNDLVKETKNNIKILEINFNFKNEIDFSTFLDISVYKNHPHMKCVTEEYLEKNKFRNIEKLEMLHAMQNSFTSFFKVLEKREDGCVLLEDLITNKTYKVVDLSLSNPMYEKNITFFYSRIITINGICFLTGLMAFPTNIKKINNYIKDCKYKKKSKLVEILEVFHLNKEYGLKVKTNKIE